MIRFFQFFVSLIVLAGCESNISTANPDAEVIEQLRLAGSDTSKPHPIEFFLYFPTAKAADAVCDILRSQNFTASAQPSASTSDFVCLATKSLIPTVEEMNRLTIEFNSLAARFDGEYDGWGSPVIE